MKLSPHFTLDEFTASDTAIRRGIDNTLPDSLLPAAYNTAALMESIRGYLGTLARRDVPISISSGYRCLMLNRVIGSRDTSDHVQALACDFRAPAYGTAFAVAKALVPVFDSLRIGQLIFEGSWIHVSTKTPDKMINRILTIHGNDVQVGIVGP